MAARLVRHNLMARGHTAASAAAHAASFVTLARMARREAAARAAAPFAPVAHPARVGRAAPPRAVLPPKMAVTPGAIGAHRLLAHPRIVR